MNLTIPAITLSVDVDRYIEIFYILWNETKYTVHKSVSEGDAFVQKQLPGLDPILYEFLVEITSLSSTLPIAL